VVAEPVGFERFRRLVDLQDERGESATCSRRCPCRENNTKNTCEFGNGSPPLYFICCGESLRRSLNQL
jgi:hypothetical protein